MNEESPDQANPEPPRIVSISRELMAEVANKAREAALTVAKQNGMGEIEAALMVCYAAGFYAAYVGMALPPDTPIGAFQPFSRGYTDEIVAHMNEIEAEAKNASMH